MDSAANPIIIVPDDGNRDIEKLLIFVTKSELFSKHDPVKLQIIAPSIIALPLGASRSAFFGFVEA